MGNRITKNEMVKAHNFDKKVAKEKWYKLVEIINRSNLERKSGNNEAMMVGIKGYDEIDIELFPIASPANGEFVHIQIWGRPNHDKHAERIKCPKSIIDAINHINLIIREIEYFANKK